MHALPSRPARSRRGRSRRVAVLALLSAAAVSLGAAGCRNLAEQRAVRRFGDALSEESLAALAEATTPQFRQVALDHDSALDDLRLLRLPKGELEVMAVTDVPEDEWETPGAPECLVIVETPPPTRTARFKLVRADAGRWLVDDVLLKQKRRGVKAVVSVTEQLELLAAVHAFTDAWGSGTQADRLAVVTPELREDLSALPERRLAELAAWVVDADRVKNLQPKTEMDADEAAVQFAGRGYTLLVSLEKQDGAWLVKDAAAENRGGGPKIPSLERTCVALTGVSRFLEAYAAGDREALRQTVAPALFNGCLNAADLASVPLPTAADLDGDSTFQIHGDRAEVVVTTGAGVATVSLTDPHRFDADRRTGAFLVSEVSVRGADGEQRLLSSIFTARAAVTAFVAAAASGDVHALKAASTRELSEAVWSRVGPADLAALPLAGAAAGGRGTVLAETHAGPKTEITFDSPAGARTFVLKEERGAAKVDDVLSPALGLPESFRQTCELILPARAFAGSLAAADLTGLRSNSSGAFNRLVWHQLHAVPAAAGVAAAKLTGPLATATPLTRGEGARCELLFGTPTDGVVLHLVRERGRLVADDVELIAGAHPDARVALKQAIREQMADGTLQLAGNLIPRPVPAAPAAPAIAAAPAMTDPAVRPAGFTAPARAGATPAERVRGAVRTAAFERMDPPPRSSRPAAPAADPPPEFAPVRTAARLPAGAAAPVRGQDGTGAAPFADPLPLGGSPGE